MNDINPCFHYWLTQFSSFIICSGFSRELQRNKSVSLYPSFSMFLYLSSWFLCNTLSPLLFNRGVYVTRFISPVVCITLIFTLFIFFFIVLDIQSKPLMDISFIPSENDFELFPLWAKRDSLGRTEELVLPIGERRSQFSPPPLWKEPVNNQ